MFKTRREIEDIKGRLAQVLKRLAKVECNHRWIVSDAWRSGDYCGGESNGRWIVRWECRQCGSSKLGKADELTAGYRQVLRELGFGDIPEPEQTS